MQRTALIQQTTRLDIRRILEIGILKGWRKVPNARGSAKLVLWIRLRSSNDCCCIKIVIIGDSRSKGLVLGKHTMVSCLFVSFDTIEDQIGTVDIGREMSFKGHWRST